jgi:DNA-binding MarR family transcriptional regulator
MGSARAGSDEQSLASAAAVYGLLSTLLRRAPRDISLTSLATLSTLDRAGTKKITELAVIEGVTQPSMTTLIAGLEKAGLVERSGDPNDRRVSMVSLTGLPHQRRPRLHQGAPAGGHRGFRDPGQRAATAGGGGAGGGGPGPGATA